MLYFLNSFYRRTLALLIAGVLLILLMPHFAQAQTGPIWETVGRGGTPTIVNPTTSGGGGAGTTISGGGGGAAIGNSSGDTLAAETPPETPPPPTESSASIGDRITLFIYGIFVSIGGIVAWFGGMALDYSLHEFLVQMGSKLRGNFGLTVDYLWTVIRDLLNLLFIFALIFIGIRTILNSDDSGVKKQLGWLIIAALLINFSLLITKTIVDFTNIAAYQIYQAITVTHEPGSTSPFNAIYRSFSGDITRPDEAPEGYGRVVSISGAFMQQFNLASYAAPNLDESAVGGTGETGASGISWKLIGFGMLIMFMMIIAGFVFLSGAYLIIHRFIVLLILMILSPVMFLGWIYPGLRGHMDKWWHVFLRTAFVAPLYLFFIYVALQMSTAMADNNHILNYGNAYRAGDSGDAFAAFVYFFVMCGFLIAASRAAQFIGAEGATMTAKIGGTGVGLIYRNTAGLAANRTLKGMDFVDRKLASVQDANSNRSNFNPRKWATGAFTSIGREVAGGTSTRGAVETARNYGPLGTRSLKQTEADMATQNQRAARGTAVAKIVAGLQSTDVAKQQQAIADMSNDQLKEILDSGSGFALIKKRAGMLTGSQAKAIAESKELNDAQRNELLGERSNQMQNRFTAPGPTTPKLKDASKDELAALGYEFLSKPENAIKLKDDQIKNLDIIDVHKQVVKDAKKNAIIEVIRDGQNIGGIQTSNFASASPNDIADLPDEAFWTPNNAQRANVYNFVTNLPIAALNEIARKKGKPLQTQIRGQLKLAAQAQPNSPLNDWLNNDRIGKGFGV